MLTDKLCTLKVLFEDNHKNSGVYHGPQYCRVVERRKYWAFDTSFSAADHDWSGLWLIDKNTEWVWSIAAYGQKNKLVMKLDDLIKHYQIKMEVA